jgi:hypothetical protein
MFRRHKCGPALDSPRVAEGRSPCMRLIKIKSHIALICLSSSAIASMLAAPDALSQNWYPAGYRTSPALPRDRCLKASGLGFCSDADIANRSYTKG